MGFTDQVKTDLDCDILIYKFYRAREKAMAAIQGDIRDQYALLWDYCEELKRSNLGSTVCLHSKKQEFWRLYCCFAACKQEFIAGCRPIVGLDACFFKRVIMKGFY